MNPTSPDPADAPAQPAGPAQTAGSGPPDAAARWRPGRRTVAVLIAVAVLLGGVAFAGYVAWEVYGTDVVARGRQAELRDQLRATWQYPTVTDVLGPQFTVAALGTADALVRIPRFGDDYEMPLVEGVRGEDLSRGLGHFPGTGPGQIGNFALTGYRTTHAEPFRDLATLRSGDEVVVETADATYTYELDTAPDDLVVPFTESWVTEAVPEPPDGEAPPGMPELSSVRPTTAVITLTSSSELFHADDRLVAFGHLVSTSPK